MPKAGLPKGQPGVIWELWPHQLICGGETDADMVWAGYIIRCWDDLAREPAERIACSDGEDDNSAHNWTGSAAR